MMTPRRHTTRARIAGAMSLLATCCLAWSASATTLLRLELAQLVDLSEQIVHGRVTQLSSVREEGRIFTYVTIQPIEKIKGDASLEPVVIRQLGGRLDDLMTIVHGMPDFSIGEEMVVFLERPMPDKPLVVTGMVQGKFRVEVSPDGTTRYVTPELHDTPLVERVKLYDAQGTPRKQLAHTGPDPALQQTQELDAFKLTLRRELDR